MTKGDGYDPDDASAAPSPEAAQRLRDAVARRTGELRTRTEVDLAITRGLVDAGEERSAAEVIAEYQRVLRAYASDLDRLVADAAVEREAERVVAASVVALDDGEPHDTAIPTAAPTPPADAAGADGGAPGSLRRVLGGALTAVVIAAAVIVPNVRSAPEGQLAAVELEARAELEQARERLSALQGSPTAAAAVTTETRELHDRILALPDDALEREVVRDQIRQLLDLGQAALEQVAPSAPAAHDLLAEVRAIRASLQLGAATATLAPVIEAGVDDAVGGGAEGLPDDLGARLDPRGQRDGATSADADAEADHGAGDEAPERLPSWPASRERGTQTD